MLGFKAAIDLEDEGDKKKAVEVSLSLSLSFLFLASSFFYSFFEFVLSRA